MSVAIEAAARLACKRLVAQGKPLVEANVMAEFAVLYVRAYLVAQQLRTQIASQRAAANRAAAPPIKAESVSIYAEILGQERQGEESSPEPPELPDTAALLYAPLAAVPTCKSAGRAAVSIDSWVTRQQANADLDLPAVLRRA